MNLTDKNFIIGADECGYGSFAGCVTACGVKAPKDWSLEGLNDSKKLSPKKRQVMRDKLLQLISNNEISYHIASRPNTYIDEIGLGKALKESYVEIFHKLYSSDSLIIIDGILKFDNLGVDAYDKESIIKADEKIPHVMAASILGKTFRDAQMVEYSSKYPQYNFENNMGYGSPKHIKAIKEYGLSDLHRKSYNYKFI